MEPRRAALLIGGIFAVGFAYGYAFGFTGASC